MFQSNIIPNLQIKPDRPIRIAIVGGPGSGKTSVIEQLQESLHQKFTVFPEVARQILTQNPDAYKNQVRFQEDIYQKSTQYYHDAIPGQFNIYDRGIIDIAIYNFFRRVWTLQDVETFFKSYTYPYDLIIIAPFNIDFYQNDEQRHETPEQAEQIHLITETICRLYEKVIGPYIQFTPDSTINERTSSILNLAA